MIEKSTLEFLKKLSRNNEREWFQANKKAYEAAQDNMIAFAGYIIGEIGKFDSAVAAIDPKSCVFRIYRDVRFSKDKSPTKQISAPTSVPAAANRCSPATIFISNRARVS